MELEFPEFVGVVSTNSLLEQLNHWDNRPPERCQLILFPGAKVATEMLDWLNENLTFIQRNLVEHDSEFQQIIPYVVATHDGIDEKSSRIQKSILAFFRHGGEKRLAGKRSVGIGGHINPLDADDPIHGCAEREWEEETCGNVVEHILPVGIIFGGEGVNATHTGVVMKYNTRGKLPVEAVESDELSGGYVKLIALLDHFHQHESEYETWSRLVLDTMRKKTWGQI